LAGSARQRVLFRSSEIPFESFCISGLGTGGSGTSQDSDQKIDAGDALPPPPRAGKSACIEVVGWDLERQGEVGRNVVAPPAIIVLVNARSCQQDARRPRYW
jgi:hypothetical protein